MNGQNKKIYFQNEYKDSLDYLRDKYAKNKILIPDYELPSLISLSHYPELMNIDIEFKYASIQTTMSCVPYQDFSLRNNDRSYVISINNNPHFKGVLLKDVPFNAQVGVICHELAHIVDYEDRNIFGLIQRGIEYLSEKNKESFEKEIDRITIEHGLGWQLHDWADYVLHRSNATDEYKAFKKRVYLEPSEILYYMIKITLSSKYKPLHGQLDDSQIEKISGGIRELRRNRNRISSPIQ